MMKRFFSPRKSPIQELEEKRARVELDIMQEKRKRMVHKRDDDFDPRESEEDYGKRLSARRKRGY